MPHGMIVGPTGCGKTTLAKQIVRRARAAGVGCLVLDPSNAIWECEFQTADINLFMQIAEANTRCLLIVDEAGEAIGNARSNATADRIKLGTRSRHQGNSAIFIGQYASLIAAPIRRQCEYAYIFRQSGKDLAILAQELCNDRISEAKNLGKGECVRAGRFGELEKINVFSLDNHVKL